MRSTAGVMILLAACGTTDGAQGVVDESGSLGLRLDEAEFYLTNDSAAAGTEIRITRATDVIPDAVTSVYRFEPAGLRFTGEAQVCFDVAAPARSGIRWGEPSNLETLDSRPEVGRVCARIEHFSIGAGIMVGDVDAGQLDSAVVGDSSLPDGRTLDAPHDSVDVPIPDAGVDTGPDAGVDTGVDGGVPPGIVNIGCWTDEVVPDATRHGASAKVGDALYFLDGARLHRRTAGVWSSIDLPSAAGIVSDNDSPEWSGTAITVGDDDSLHVVLSDNSPVARTGYPRFPYYLHQAAGAWVVERIPFSTLSSPCTFHDRTNVIPLSVTLHDGDIHVAMWCAGTVRTRPEIPIHCHRDAEWHECTTIDWGGGVTDPIQFQLVSDSSGVSAFVHSVDDPAGGASWYRFATWRAGLWEGVEDVDFMPQVPGNYGTYGPQAVLLSTSTGPVLYYDGGNALPEDFEAGLWNASTSLRRNRFAGAGFEFVDLLTGTYQQEAFGPLVTYPFAALAAAANPEFEYVFHTDNSGGVVLSVIAGHTVAVTVDVPFADFTLPYQLYSREAPQAEAIVDSTALHVLYTDDDGAVHHAMTCP